MMQFMNLTLKGSQALDYYFLGGWVGLFWEIHFNEKSEEVISMRSLSECPNMPTRHMGAEWSCWFCGRAPKATTGQRSAGQTFDPAAST